MLVHQRTIAWSQVVWGTASKPRGLRCCLDAPRVACDFKNFLCCQFHLILHLMFQNKKPGVLFGASGLVALTFRSVARFYPFATRRLAPRMLMLRFQLNPIKRDRCLDSLVTRRLMTWTVTTHMPATRDRTAARNGRANALRSVCVIAGCAIVFTITPSLVGVSWCLCCGIF